MQVLSRYFTNDELVAHMKNFTQRCSAISKLHLIGYSVSDTRCAPPCRMLRCIASALQYPHTPAAATSNWHFAGPQGPAVRAGDLQQAGG